MFDSPTSRDLESLTYWAANPRQPFDFHGANSVHVDYFSEVDDDEHDRACLKEGICRCSRIEDARVESFSPLGMADSLVSIPARQVLDYERRVLEAYVIERFLTRLELTAEDFEIKIEGGYYGEEIGAVNLRPDRAARLADACRKVDRSETDELARLALELDYGHVLPRLEGKRFRRLRVRLEDLVLPNRERLASLDQDALARYREDAKRIEIQRTIYRRLSSHRVSEPPLAEVPRGVALASGGRYRLLDGYHRVSAARDDGAADVSLLVAE
jgi:hypothetical protein